MLKFTKSRVVAVGCVMVAAIVFGMWRYGIVQKSKAVKLQHTSNPPPPSPPSNPKKDDIDAGITKDNATSHVVYSREYKYPSTGGPARSSFSQDGNLFGSARLKHDSATLRIWNVHSHSRFRALKIPRLRNFAFSPDHKSIAVIMGESVRYGLSYPYAIRIYDLHSGKVKSVLLKMGTVSAAFYNIIYSRDGRYIAADAGNSKIYVWNVKTGKRVALFRIHGFATAIAFSPNGKTLAAASGQEGWRAEARLSVWSIRPNKLLRSIKLDHSLEALTFSPHGELLATNGIVNGSNNWMDILDVKTLKTKYRLRKNVNAVDNYKAVFSPDGNYLAVAKDEFVYIYKLRNTTHAIARFPIPFTFDSDGTYPMLLAIHFTSSRQLIWAVSSYEDKYKITLWQGTFRDQ